MSQPWARASAARYSSLRVLLPPKARPELTSSRLAQISTLAAEVLAQPIEPLQGRRAEGEGDAGEGFEGGTRHGWLLGQVWISAMMALRAPLAGRI